MARFGDAQIGHLDGVLQGVFDFRMGGVGLRDERFGGAQACAAVRLAPEREGDADPRDPVGFGESQIVLDEVFLAVGKKLRMEGPFGRLHAFERLIALRANARELRIEAKRLFGPVRERSEVAVDHEERRSQFRNRVRLEKVSEFGFGDAAVRLGDHEFAFRGVAGDFDRHALDRGDDALFLKALGTRKRLLFVLEHLRAQGFYGARKLHAPVLGGEFRVERLLGRVALRAALRHLVAKGLLLGRDHAARIEGPDHVERGAGTPDVLLHADVEAVGQGNSESPKLGRYGNRVVEPHFDRFRAPDLHGGKIDLRAVHGAGGLLLVLIVGDLRVSDAETVGGAVQTRACVVKTQGRLGLLRLRRGFLRGRDRRFGSRSAGTQKSRAGEESDLGNQREKRHE